MKALLDGESFSFLHYRLGLSQHMNDNGNIDVYELIQDNRIAGGLNKGSIVNTNRKPQLRIFNLK